MVKLRKLNRFILVVLDSAGIGELPDAEKYGDKGADTLGHVIESSGSDFVLPNLAFLGLYNLFHKKYLKSAVELIGSYGKMECASLGKDTTVGHWEIAGIILNKPFPTYPNGFPKELIFEFEKRIGTKILGNYPASGTEIIKQLGQEHCRTGYPIVYTSADSVFQIAAHEKSFGLEKLYDVCRIARQMLSGEHGVCRVIARPFKGKPGSFVRTENRRDFSLSPAGTTILDKIKNSDGEVTAVGKIEDIFNKQGITKAIHTRSNSEGISVTIDAVSKEPHSPTLIFTNLVDFDMLWGHRRNVKAYADGLKEFDNSLPAIIAKMRGEDILIITADHGCDPTFTRHTDHTREYVPLLVYGKKIKAGVNLKVRSTFADIAQTIADTFNLPPMEHGTSFKQSIFE